MDERRCGAADGPRADRPHIVGVDDDLGSSLDPRLSVPARHRSGRPARSRSFGLGFGRTEPQGGSVRVFAFALGRFRPERHGHKPAQRRPAPGGGKGPESKRFACRRRSPTHLRGRVRSQIHPFAGSCPFLLQGAKGLHFHAKAGPDDQGAVYIEIDQAVARLDGLVGRIANGRQADFVLDGIYSRAGSLRGRDWVSSVRSWSAANGHLTLRRLRVSAGQAELMASSGDIAVGADGKIVGGLNLVLRQAPRTLNAMVAEGDLRPETAQIAEVVAGARRNGAFANLPLSFQAGRATLGPVAIGPAPRIY